LNRREKIGLYAVRYDDDPVPGKTRLNDLVFRFPGRTDYEVEAVL
jgi:hypothetical protein